MILEPNAVSISIDKNACEGFGCTLINLHLKIKEQEYHHQSTHKFRFSGNSESEHREIQTDFFYLLVVRFDSLRVLFFHPSWARSKWID